MLPVTSLGGYLYYAIFVDDFSCKTWIYFLKKKDEVFKWFRSFKALVENQTGKKIKILRTDNGTEYESNEFNDYYRETGIKTETTTTYTPEKNGVVERKNQTLIDATRAMLQDQVYQSSYGEKLPTSLCMFKIDAHIKHWNSRHLKKFSLVRNLMFLILEFLVVPYIFMCRKRKETS